MLTDDMLAILNYLNDKGYNNEDYGGLVSKTFTVLNISASRFEKAKNGLLKEGLIGYNHPVIFITTSGILKLGE